MILGQSAGIAAAMSVQENKSVQELPYPQLRQRLLAQGQVLELPVITPEPPTVNSIAVKTLPGIVLDNTKASLSGDWARSTNFKPYIGTDYLHDEKKGDGKSSATFRFRVPKTGRYQLLMAYSAHETRAKNVPLTVACGANKTTLTVDQTKPMPPGKTLSSYRYD